jgi:hypothetical protein
MPFMHGYLGPRTIVSVEDLADPQHAFIAVSSNLSLKFG